jgi:hypothetical protein
MKRTVIQQIEVVPPGRVIQVRMVKQIVDEDGTVYDLGYHRTIVEPDVTPDAQLGAVNSSLAQMKCGAVDGADWQLVRDIAAAVHTEKVKKDWAAKRAADSERSHGRNT